MGVCVRVLVLVFVLVCVGVCVRVLVLVLVAVCDGVLVLVGVLVRLTANLLTDALFTANVSC